MRSTKDEQGRRRWGTRKVRDGELTSEARRWWHNLTARAWLVLVPFVGIAWANHVWVRPEVSAIEQEADTARRAALEKAAEFRRQAVDARLQAVTRAAAAEAEYAPGLLRHRTTLDSLIVVRRAMGGEPARLALQVDSLRQTIRRYEDGNRRLRDAQGERNAVLAALEARRGGLQDSLAAVERQLARVDAELQRREQRGDLGDYVNYVWYVVVPWLGALWAQDS